MQDDRNVKTKGSSFSKQAWIKQLASREEADGVPCNGKGTNLIQKEMQISIHPLHMNHTK